MKIVGYNNGNKEKPVTYDVATGFDKKVIVAKNAVSAFNKEGSANGEILFWHMIDKSYMPIRVDMYNTYMPIKEGYRNVILPHNQEK